MLYTHQFKKSSAKEKTEQPVVTTDYEKLKKAILVEHNRLREDPVSYIPILEKQKTYFKGHILSRPKQTPIKTHEGVRAFDLAIEFLKYQKPVPALTHDERLSLAAKDHLEDHGPIGTVSHESSNGKVVAERLEKYCEWDTCCGENLDVGSTRAEDVIVSLLVDDGVKSRGHRENLFNESFRSVGIACGPHKAYGSMTVIDYSGGARQSNTSYFDYNNFKYEYPEHVRHAFKHGDKREALKVKNVYQENDPDAPNNTVAVKIEERFRFVREGDSNTMKKLSVVKKLYSLDDGTYHVVEVEDY
jgi:uncharacterized protein YkwD